MASACGQLMTRDTCHTHVVVGVVLPLAVLVLKLLTTLLSRLAPTKHASTTWTATLFSWTRIPFEPMLRLADVVESESQECEQIEVAAWKSRWLFRLSPPMLVVSIGALVTQCASGAPIQVIEHVIQVTIWVLACLVWLGNVKTTPYSVLMLWTISIVCQIVNVVTEPTLHFWKHGLFWPRLTYCIVVLLMIYVAGTFPINATLPGNQVSKPGQVPTSNESCPEDAVHLWQWLTFSFFQPVLTLSASRTLNQEDVWSLSPFLTHRNIFNKWLTFRETRKDQRIIWTLIRLNFMDLTIDLTLQMWSALFGFVATYALKRILDALSASSSTGEGDEGSNQKFVAFAFVCLHFIINLSFAQCDLLQKWHSRRCYERTRGQLFCMIHDKALRRKDFSGSTNQKGGDAKSSASKKEKDEEDEETTIHASIGKVANLINGDAYSVAQRFWDFAGVLITPVRLFVALGFLYSILGWSSFLGLAVVGFAYLVEWPLVKWELAITNAFLAVRDSRIGASTETIQSIRFLKYMGWENVWARKVQKIRQQELKLRIKDLLVNCIRMTVWNWVPSAILVVCFWGFTAISGHRLSVSTAFVSISLFSNLQSALRSLPAQITEWLRAMVSVRRIEAYLREEDVPDWVSTLSRPSPSPVPAGRVVFDDASFIWPSTNNPTPPALSTTSNTVSSSRPGSGTVAPKNFQLGPISLTLPVGKLTLVIGATGSGKTSFLSAILGEMDCSGGSVFVDKNSLAYAAQHPWIEHYSIRDNIIFETPFDQNRYDSVLDACSLRQDLATLTHGDRTQIGERGVSLSGGQKARISLARAIYSRAKLVLLDDPLAAVDMHTARLLVEEGFKGPLLKDRTVVLVTHHVSLCRDIASQVIRIDHGSIHVENIQDLVVEEVEEIVTEPEPAIESPALVNDADDGSSTEVANSPHPSTFKVVDEENDKAAKLIQDEERHEGRVNTTTYITYIRSGGSIGWFILVLLAINQRLIGILSQWLLKSWGEAYPKETRLLLFLSKIPDPVAGLPSPDQDVLPWVRLFFAITAFSVFSNLMGEILGNVIEIRASRSLFSRMLLRVVRAPTRWFDQTPVGRIENRLLGDMNTVDFGLRGSLLSAIRGILAFLMSSGVIVVVVPSFAPVALVIAWLYIVIAPAYVRAARDLRRLESVARSPMFQNFSNLLYGIVSIRAYAAESRYQTRFYESCDKFQSCDHSYWLASMWLMYRYDCLGSIVVFATSLFALGANLNAGLAAIIIVQSESFADATRWIVTTFAQLELDFNAVERVGEYLVIDQEAPAEVPEHKPPDTWPSDNGGLVVQDLRARYANHLPDALKGVSFSVRPREKIGIVGRTGSGKSSLAMALLRIIEPVEGSVILDGVDIGLIGLDDLRSRITIVSQDVTLFAGSFRQNLDPLNEHSDEEIWKVLQRCHLVSTSQPLPPPQPCNETQSSIINNDDIEDDESTPTGSFVDSLDTMVSEGGHSMSAGQKQLMALARALLRRSKVVIMDEATSSIDHATDAAIQETLRSSMQDVLVLTIAHRLLTVIEYDRILVLGDGKVVEFDTPKALLQTEGSSFRHFCERSADWPILRRILD